MAKPPKTVDWSVAYACLALKCSLFLAGGLTTTPLQRILEATICRTHYREQDASVINASDDVSEELCKVAAVQEIVADINGTISALDVLPALLATLLYVVLLSRVSPRRLLLLNTCGYFVRELYYVAILYFYNSLDVRWLYLNGFFTFVGGGFAVFNSLVSALVADSIPQDSLSRFQLYSSAISLVVMVIGRATSLFMMERSTWLPVTLGITVYAVAVLIILIFFKSGPHDLSTTISHGAKTTRSGYTYRPLGNDIDDAEEEIELEDASAKLDARNIPMPMSGNTNVPLSLRSLFRQYRPVFIHGFLPIIIMSLRDFGIMYKLIMTYWMSRRFHWEIREVGWVHLGETLFTALIVATLPSFAKTFLHRTTVLTSPAGNPLSAAASIPDPLDFNITSQRAHEQNSDSATATKRLAHHDLALAKVCVLFSVVGTLLLGFSWYRFSAIVSIAVSAGGTGFQDSYFSFLAGQMVDNKDNDLTKLYMILSMMTLISADVGGWVMSGVYSIALKIGADSWWTSAPVWFATGAFMLSWIMLRRHRQL